jgi:hypothetical protein
MRLAMALSEFQNELNKTGFITTGFMKSRIHPAGA